MNKIQIGIDSISTTTLGIGFVGENEHTQVIIYWTTIANKYPNAVATMTIKSPSGETYPKSITKDGNRIIWDVTAADCASNGKGQYQLTFTNGDEVIKTYIGTFTVLDSLVGEGAPPDPVADWIQEASVALETFEQDIDAIDKITDATAGDVGKALSPKTVSGGNVTEWQYIDLADPEVVTEAIDAWLDDHPEATTTVEDGAITEPKLNDSLKSALAWQSDVDGLMNALSQSKAPVILDTATGEIVTVPDGADGMAVETLTVAIEPVQDLHGYDNPWPAGGSKNILPTTVAGLKSINTTGTWSGNTYTLNELTFTLQTDSDNNIIGINTNGTPSVTTSFYLATTFTNSNNCILNGCPSGGSYNSSYSIWSVSSNPYAERIDGGNGTTIEANTVGDVKIRIVGGYSVSNLVFKPMIRLSTVSDATFEPYSNLCPISGWSAAEVVRTGINLLDEDFEVGGLKWTDGDVYYQEDRIRTKNFNPIKPSTDYYTMRGLPYAYLFLYDKNKTFIGYSLMLNEVITTPSNAYWFKIVILETSYQNEVSVNYPSTDHNHHPYAGGQTKTYTFPAGAGTVYGGTLTVNADGTGTLVVDRAIKDLSTVTWSNIDSRGRRYQIFNDILPQTVYSVAPAKFNAENYKTVANNDLYNDTSLIGITLNDNYVYVRTGDENTPTGNLVYPLKTPVSYSLTSLEVIELLKGGTNNLWADCGDTTIEYPCDTKLYINKTIMQAIANALNA